MTFRKKISSATARRGTFAMQNIEEEDALLMAATFTVTYKKALMQAQIYRKENFIHSVDLFASVVCPLRYYPT